MKSRIITALAAVAVASCSAPGVLQTGPNTYIVSRSSAAGAFANMATLKADTIREANEFAAKHGKRAEGISLEEDRPAQGFPNVEYQFRLVGQEGGGTAIPSSVHQVQLR